MGDEQGRGGWEVECLIYTNKTVREQLTLEQTNQVLHSLKQILICFYIINICVDFELLEFCLMVIISLLHNDQIRYMG